MAHQTLDILFGVTGQSLYFDAPEGRPSSVTSSDVFASTVGDDGTEEAATTGSAAVETTPNTTFDAASGDGQADPTKCNLTATTGAAIGRVYLATNATGESDWVEAMAIASADYVTAREPLKNAYTTADTFVSTRITHAVDSTWVADKTNLSAVLDPNPAYRWRLVYVVSSVTYVHDVYFDLVRYAARHDVTGLSVDQLFPGWIDALPTYYREDQGKTLIDEAFRAVKFGLYNLAVPDQAVRNREALNQLVKLKAGEMVFQTDINARRYDDMFAQLLTWAKAAVQVDESGAATRPRTKPLWRR